MASPRACARCGAPPSTRSRAPSTSSSRPAPGSPPVDWCSASTATETGVAMVDRIDYDEFGLFHENAEEYGLAFDAPPVVRRTSVEVAPGRAVSALVWGGGEPELVFLHGGAQNAHTWDTVAMALDRSLVAIDLPGHGHSDGPGEAPEGQLNAEGNATDVAVAIRALAPEARAVVGMS